MSVRDLKLAIVDQRKLNNITEFDLSVKNQQTNQVTVEMIQHSNSVINNIAISLCLFHESNQ